MLSYFNVELIRSINASSNFLQRFTSIYAQNAHVGRDVNTSRYRESTINDYSKRTIRLPSSDRVRR